MPSISPKTKSTNSQSAREALYALEPVKFRYKKKSTPQAHRSSDSWRRMWKK